MREQELKDKYPYLEYTINIYYTIDNEGNVTIDDESMREEFEEFISKIVGETQTK